MHVLLTTGEGLEGIARDEVLAKVPGCTVTACPHGMKGHVELRALAGKEDELARGMDRLRCFESIYLVLHEETPGKGWLDSKRQAESMIRSLFSSTFTALKHPMAGAVLGMSWRGPFGIAIPVPAFLRRMGFTQPQLEAIAGREASAAGTSLAMKRKGVPRIYIKCFPRALLGMLQLPRRPGNLPLPRVHPTGLFPNHAFGLISHALSALVAVSGAIVEGHGDHLVVVDPMAGAGTIPAMLVADAAHFTASLPFPAKLAITAIEHDAGFHEMMVENLQAVSRDEDHVASVDLVHANHAAVEMKCVDAIITQPPYGYSIRVSDVELTSLHAALFDTAARWLRPGGVLATISPRDDVITPLARDRGWTAVATRRVQEHGTTCSVHAFRRGP